MATITRIAAGQVDADLKDHLTKHADVYDPRSEKMHRTLYGDRGTNGLAGQFEIQGVCMKQIDEKLANINDTMKWLTRLVLGAVILAVLGMVFVK